MAYNDVYDFDGTKLRTGQVFPCPFKYAHIDHSTGKTVYDAEDDKRVRFCGVGKSSHCRMCKHYNKSKYSKEQEKRIFDGIKIKGKAPHLWKRPRPAKVVNPLNLRLTKPRGPPLIARKIG